MKLSHIPLLALPLMQSACDGDRHDHNFFTRKVKTAEGDVVKISCGLREECLAKLKQEVEKGHSFVLEDVESQLPGELSRRETSNACVLDLRDTNNDGIWGPTDDPRHKRACTGWNIGGSGGVYTPN